MSSLKIRLAEDSDNEQLVELSKRCPQEGMITFFTNRTPRFNTLHRILDPGSWHFVACKDNRIIGLVGVIHFQASVLGKLSKIGYMLDLRVDKEFRNGLTAFRLVKTAVDCLRDSDADFVIANMLKDNKRPLAFTTGRGGLPPSLYLGDNKVLNILPVSFMKTDPRFEIDQLTHDDLPEVVEIYRRYALRFKIAPNITTELLGNYVNKIIGLSPGNFIIARENDKIRAITAIWDEHTYKAYQVLKLNTPIRLANNLLKFLSFFMRVPRPLRLNEPLKQLSLVLYAHNDCPEALETLFRHVNNINLGSEYTLLTLYAQENDPVFNLMKRFKGVSIKSEMHIFARDMSVFEQLSADPRSVWFDLTMVL